MGCHDAKLLEFGIAARSLQPSPGPRSSGWFSGWMTEVAALVTDVAGLRQHKLGGSREGTLPQQTFSSFPSHASFFSPLPLPSSVLRFSFRFLLLFLRADSSRGSAG